MNILKQFYSNVHEREEVHNYLINVLKDMTVERAFEKQDVSGIADAKEAIDTAFSKLEVEFGEKPDPRPINSK